MITFTCYLNNGKSVKIQETSRYKAEAKIEEKYPDVTLEYIVEGGDTEFLWSEETKLWYPNPSYYPTVLDETTQIIYGNYCSPTPLILSNGIEVPNVNIKRANKLFPQIEELSSDKFGDTSISIDVTEKAIDVIDTWRLMHKTGLVHIVFMPIQFYYLFTSNMIRPIGDDPFRIPCVLKNGKISINKFYVPW